MFDELKLKATLTMKRKTVGDLANAIGVSKPTLYRKFRGQSDFTRNEIALIAQVLDLSAVEVNDIFFGEKVS